MVNLSIIIPCYNEEKRIGETIDIIKKYFGDNKQEIELLVVDDGSTDNTVRIVRGRGVKIIICGLNRGKGFAVRVGVLTAKGDWVLFCDADLSTPIETVEQMFGVGAEVVIGSRNVVGSKIFVRQPLVRSFLGKLFPKLVNFFLLPDIKDTQCGFKLFSKRAVQDIFWEQKIDGFGFDVEVLCIARRKGYKVVEVPVSWYNSDSSKFNIVTDSPKMFFDLTKLVINK